jgi:hypothetical protein
MNRVRTNLVRVAPSKLVHGEAGLFACQDIEEGTVVAVFGAVRQLREGEEGTRTRLGYSFIVKEREGKSLTITPKHGVTEGCMAHAINHTCHPGFANCRFVHAGIVGGWSEDEQGGIGGRRTSEVFVKTTKRVEIDTFVEMCIVHRQHTYLVGTANLGLPSSLCSTCCRDSPSWPIYSTSCDWLSFGWL